jgi:hypothetical protein
MAKIYYDMQSPTNGIGTPTDPKNTWATPSSADEIYFKRGSVFIRFGQLTMGSAASLVLNAWANPDGSDNPLLPKPIISAYTTTSTFMPFSGAGIHRIRNIEFNNIYGADKSASAPSCISFGAVGTLNVDPGVNGSVTDCDFFNIGGNAIQFNGIGSSSFASLAAEYAVVSRCNFDNIGTDAVFAKVKGYFEVSHCRMTNLSVNDTNGDGVGFLDSNPRFAWIRDNYIDHRNKDSKQCIIIDGVDGSGFALIENNELYGFGTKYSQANLHVPINVEGTRSIIRQNNIKNICGFGIVVNAPSEIYSNILEVINYRDNAHTISVLASNSKICNNKISTDSLNTGTAVAFGSGRSNIQLKNNICTGADVFSSIPAGTTIDAGANRLYNVNTYYSNLGTLNQIAADTYTKPEIQGNLEPAESLVGSGLFIGYVKDYKGKTFYNPPSVGPVEYERPRLTRN